MDAFTKEIFKAGIFSQNTGEHANLQNGDHHVEQAIRLFITRDLYQFIGDVFDEGIVACGEYTQLDVDFLSCGCVKS
ncbi:hypothetical protein D3C78_661530 [compost metagenome]